MQQSLPGSIALFMVWILVGCGELNQPNEKEVVWAQLRVLDEFSETVLQYGNKNEIESVREHAGELWGAARLAGEDAPPENVKNLEQVQLLQQDLLGLIKDQLESLQDDELVERVKAIHAVTVKLMESAGMPHVHDHNGHGNHDGHNH